MCHTSHEVYFNKKQLEWEYQKITKLLKNNKVRCIKYPQINLLLQFCETKCINLISTFIQVFIQQSLNCWELIFIIDWKSPKGLDENTFQFISRKIKSPIYGPMECFTQADFIRR